MSLRLVHPHTGEALEPLYIDKFGQARWPILGASEDDEDKDDKEKDKDDADSGGDSKDDSDSGSGSSEDKDKSKDGDSKDLEAQIQNLTDRMKAADRRADAAEKKAREYEDKDKDKVEILERDLGEAQKENETLKTEIADLRFANAFALNAKYTWQDPEVVLGLLRKREDVEVQEDGSLKGLEKALDAIAKDKPFLVKDGDEEDDKDDDKDGRPPRAGSKTGSTRNKDGKVDEKAVRKKFRI